MAVSTLYKARGMSVKRPVCAICVDRTRGLTARRSGRDFVLTLQRLWGAHGCLTAARSRALSTHLAEMTERPGSPKPGSYSWPALRRLAEDEFAEGGPPMPTITRLRGLYSGERRWVEPDRYAALESFSFFQGVTLSCPWAISSRAIVR
jgi:hypothetical protein